MAPDAGPVARQVHYRMVDMGLSPKALSLRAGLNETYVRDLLIGRSRNPKGHQLTQLAAALECEVADLLNAVDPGPARTKPESGDLIYDPEERAVVYLWRMLTPLGRRRVMDSIRKAIPGDRPSAA
ncbi:MAG TPA: helix-turn-helix transcriptional regulator [Candidatus Binataceae bacterium]